MKSWNHSWNDECGLTDKEDVMFKEIVTNETRPGASRRISQSLIEYSDNIKVLEMWAECLYPHTLWREEESIVESRGDQ